MFCDMSHLFRRLSVPLSTLFAVLFGVAFPIAQPVHARNSEIRVVANTELNFGTFMVFGNGTRTVSSSGAVTDQGVVALEGERTKPARFTVLYDKGSGKNEAIDISVEIVISTPNRIRENGVSAHLSAFETNLPGYGRVTTGQVLRLRIDNCRSRRCSRSFNIGGQLHVTRQFGGSNLVVPIELDARLVSVEPV